MTNDPVPVDEYREFCSVVGHLFIAFGRLEGVLSAVLKVHLTSRMEGDENKGAIALASAIYGSMRFKASRDIMKRLMVAEETPRPIADFVLKVFEHVGHIENLRDLLAHQEITPAPAGYPHWQVCDAITSKNLNSVRVYLFTSDAVAQAGNDLIEAAGRIGAGRLSDKLFSSEAFDISPVPWLYKSSMLKHVPQNKVRDHIVRAPPHQS